MTLRSLLLDYQGMYVNMIDCEHCWSWQLVLSVVQQPPSHFSSIITASVSCTRAVAPRIPLALWGALSIYNVRGDVLLIIQTRTTRNTAHHTAVRRYYFHLFQEAFFHSRHVWDPRTTATHIINKLTTKTMHSAKKCNDCDLESV